jgi:hypothetical protein
MSVVRAEKLKPLLERWTPNTVATSAHLGGLGITAQDVQKYVTSRWLIPIGRGAFQRPQERVTWQGALHSIQTQLKLPVHVGALTALALSGHEHYLRISGVTIFLFSPPGIALPRWFKAHWGDEIRHVQTKLLPSDLGVTTRDTVEGFSLTCAAPERAALEMLHLAPKGFDLIEAAHIIEGMTTLRPALMQTLLEACASVKVKRLFLHLAERADLPVIKQLDVAVLNLGEGDRSLVAAGKYAARYRLILPEELVGNGS